MRSGETYDEWHRREYPTQYVWENYSYPDLGLSDEKLVCRIPIRILNCDNCQLIIENKEFSQTHKMTIDYVIANQESFVEEIRTGVFEYYTFLWNNYLNEFEDEIKYPNPKINISQIIDAMIKPKAIHMAAKISEGYFGIEFRNYKVKDVGGEDVGFNLISDE